jgi:catechol 2,3-dioxygenase-like lactoylglutathione lyase family enzyme
MVAFTTGDEPMLEIQDLNHVNLVVKDLASAKQFYCEVLGMAERPRPADLAVRGAWLYSRSAEIHLIVEAFATHAPGDLSFDLPSKESVDIASSRHFSLVVNDTAALIECLSTHGVPIVFGPVKRFGGIVQTYSYDPDGHLVEFTQLPSG